MNNLLPETIEYLLARQSARLTFPEEAENYFQHKIRDRRTRHIVYSSLVGLLVYLLFSICDYVLLTDIYKKVWIFRFFIAIPLMIGVLLLFPRIEDHRWRESLVAAGAVLVMALTCWLI